MANEYLNNKVFEGIIEKFQTSKRNKAKCELLMEDLLGAKERRQKRQDKNIKRGKLLLDQLDEKSSEYEKVCDEFGSSQEDLALAFYTLSENIVRYAKFHFIDPEDAIQEGVMICFEKVDRFNPNYRGKNGQKAKAFNYMTTCILNHFRQLYRTARNYQELKKKYLNFLQGELEKIVIRNGRLHAPNSSELPMDSYRSRY